ncbi:FtsL-like putative cell division protein [Mongoliitalea daihaiensis]|uniref:FtsL-like putative cell division protein n=1 Tax=Mongoliitalea daihaiensis TaxID=2782006 RepID=UPI001F18EA5C|nr:FtsL-like putative cell division protein [Mongoliitalea daihaiensis]UJP66559.1 hypothetical protein IPZ59_08185 [Mongoliitalea daihaiensis]
MTENTFRKRIKANGKSSASQGSLFSKLDEKLNVTAVFGVGIPVKFVPPIMYAAFIAMIYIWSNHRSERMIRQIDLMQREVEDLRADVTTLEAEFMYSSKQSEVAKKIELLGIEEIKEPPFKIVSKK